MNPRQADFTVVTVLAAAIGLIAASCTSDSVDSSGAAAVDAGPDGDADAGSDGDVGPCRSSAQCPSLLSCIAPGMGTCGTVKGDECSSDESCKDAGTDFICAARTGPCDNATCRAKCTGDASCPSTPAGPQACSLSTGHCGPKPCTPTSCPANYACIDPARGCDRKECTADSECSGACVDGRCYDGPGRCMTVQ